MAKRIIKWETKETLLTVSDVDGITYDTFNLATMFPMWLDMNTVQQYVVLYGIKQALADAGASDTLASEKINSARRKWDALMAGEVATSRAMSPEEKEAKAREAITEAEDRLAAFNGLSPAEQATAAVLGVSRAILEANIAKLKKALDKLSK